MNEAHDRPAAAAPGRATRARAGTGRVVASTHGSGGRYAPLGPGEPECIHAAALDLLAKVGLSDAPADMVARVGAAGGALDDTGRLQFPADLVARALDGLRRPLVLCGQDARYDLMLDGTRVHAGTGGAAPMLIELGTDRYRHSTLRDLYDAARLVDALEHVHFFSRSLVACDMPDAATLDINTTFAALAGTSKHVMVSATDAASVDAIAAICARVAGSAEAFRARPFLSLNVNHVVPPMRLAPEACGVLAAAVRHGIPVHVNTFGQLGASSPVTIAGCLAQTMAETLAGIVYAWLIDPAARTIFGPRPMVTDLRTGGMAGGCGEQALLTAAAVQMARFYGLPNSTIAGATDSKINDAQSGYEKCLSVTLAAQTGANLITQACGMQAGLTGCSFESYVTDNEMLGAILRTLAPVEVSDATLSVAAIGSVVRAEGHFLGQPDTLARMSSDFLYPRIADRRPPAQWQEAGAPDIRAAASARAREILAAHFPAHLPAETVLALRGQFDIRLPEHHMRPQ